MINYSTFSILFYPKNDKADRKGLVPIYCRITYNGKRVEFSTNRKISPKRWSKTGYVKGTKEDAREINEHLDSIRNKIYRAQTELTNNNELITAQILRNKVTGRDEKKKTLLEVFKYHNQQMEAKRDIEFADATIKRYKTTYSHIKKFLQYQYQKDDIYLSQLNYAFIADLEHYFKVIKNCNHNTTIKYIKNLRKVINMAIANEWLYKDPFIKFKAKLEEVPRDYISEEELKRIEEKEIDIPRLDQVRDIFIFSCYTGLAYIDVINLTKDNIRIGIDGDKWIYTYRHKTKTKSNIPLLPKAEEIIEKYKDHPSTARNDRLLPNLSNQKLNAYLKEIADLCDIKKNLTFHIARHTFATTVTLTNGVPIETVSSLLGHKNLRTTQIYSKVIEKKVSEDMGDLKKKLNKKTNNKNTKAL
jgi:site-specific recombinase XerD